MRQYRKKPVVIEAMTFDGLNVQAVADWMASYPPPEDGAPMRFERPWSKRADKRCPNCADAMGRHAQIATLEGDEHFVCPADKIIRGVKGEFYACKPNIFAATYDAVEGSPEPTP